MLDLFTYTETDYSMTEAEEAAAILSAQAGDEAAKMDLMRAYGPALRSAVSRFKSGVADGQRSRVADEFGSPSSSLDDLQSAALVAFLELIESHDPAQNPRLAGRVAVHLADSLAAQFSKEAHFAIPKRTLTRFHGILKAADGDVSAALDMAGEYGMARETFLSVLAAVQSGSIDGLTGPSDDATREPVATPIYAAAPVVDVEDRILVDMAFRAVSDEEARIVELAYGFTEYDPVPDAEIGHRLGLTRPTVQRRRASALGTMRKAIGVTHA